MARVAEQIELYYADRWRDFKPLSPAEKSDMIRAVVGYTLADDTIGLARFREKYAPLMSSEADRIVFDAASKPVGSSGADLAQIARMAASVDTLDGFARNEGEIPGRDGSRQHAAGDTEGRSFSTGSLPAIVGVKPARLAK